MPLFSGLTRASAAVGFGVSVVLAAGVVAVPATAAEPATPSSSVSPAPTATGAAAPATAAPSPTASPTPVPSSPTPSSAPTPTGDPAAAKTVTISGRVIFDKRTTTAQRAAVVISATPAGGVPVPDARVTYDPKAGTFRIADVPRGKYTVFSRMELPDGWFASSPYETVVDATTKSVSNITIDYSAARGGLATELLMFDETVAVRQLRVVATDVSTKTDTELDLIGGGVGGVYNEAILPTGTTVIVRAQYTDGRVVYYDGTATGTSDPARAVAVSIGVWSFTRLTLDWAAAAAPKLASSTPTISGIARVGRAVTVTTGVWARGATLTYQWSADGVAVRGATATSFTPGAAQKGKNITVTVTGTLAGYTSVSKTSKPTAAVAAGILTAPTPTIRGTARVGTTLAAVPGTWTSGTTLTYQWFADGAKIRGATSASFTPTTAQRGAKLTVAVTGTKAGYTSRTATSKATTAVAR
ncbi:hypothetical protein [Microbacterium testaceum]|uniref:hypothetical protein n=1 Tax=Microbacterium testaceum TaxID=2033 RepID=UPI000AE2F096|nr:hypothetical protein [Microbacterium testaceum]